MSQYGLDLDVGIREVSVRTLACVEHVGPYAGDTELFQRLFSEMDGWCMAHGLDGKSPERVVVYCNDPETTPSEQLRIAVGCVVPAGTCSEDARVEILELAGGAYAVATGTIRPDQYPAAWWELMAMWLPRSGWRPLAMPGFHVLRNDPLRDPEGLHRVELWQPVRSL